MAITEDEDSGESEDEDNDDETSETVIEESELDRGDPDARSGQPVDMDTPRRVEKQPQRLELEGPEVSQSLDLLTIDFASAAETSDPQRSLPLGGSKWAPFSFATSFSSETGDSTSLAPLSSKATVSLYEIPRHALELLMI